MYIKCYAYIDLYQEIEPKLSLSTAGTLVPIWDIPGRDKPVLNILAPAKGQQCLRFLNSFTF